MNGGGYVKADKTLLLRRRRLRMFKLISVIPIMRHFLLEKQRIQRWITPGEDEYIQTQSVRNFFKEGILILIWIVSSLFIWDWKLDSILMMVVGVFLVRSYYKFRYTRKMYDKLLIQFGEFLVNVRNLYQNTNMVEETLQEAIWEAPIEIASHIQCMMKALETEDAEQMQQYKERVAFPYLLTFFILCKTCILYGDSSVDGTSAYLSNMNHLKEEIHIEMIRRKRVNHLFSGLFFVTTFPILFIDIIRRWSIFNLPELVRYYDGGYGLLVKLLICVVTVGVFYLLMYLIEPIKFVKTEHYVLERLSEHATIKHALLTIVARNTTRWSVVHNTLVAIDSKLSTIQFLLIKIILAVGTAVGGGLVSVSIRVQSNRFLTTPISLFLEQDQLTWEKEQISLFFLVVMTVIVSIGAYYVPNVVLRIKLACRGSSTDDEVMRMLGVLIMLFPIKRMTVECILEWLSFTTWIFQPAIVDCIDCYLQDNEGALEELYEGMDNEAFRHIVRNLEDSDRIGIFHAFEEVPSEYIYYIDKRKQDNEIRTDNQSAIGKVVAFAPMVLLIGGYLIIPFVLESVSQFMSYITQMQAL